MAGNLGVWITKYLDYLRVQRNASTHTLRNYESDLQQFLSYLAHTPGGDPRPEPELHQIDNLTIREFLGILYQKGNRKASVARKLATLRSFMKFLSLQGAIQSNAAKGVSSPKLDSPVSPIDPCTLGNLQACLRTWIPSGWSISCRIFIRPAAAG